MAASSSYQHIRLYANNQASGCCDDNACNWPTWPNDIEIQNLIEAGLQHPCLLRPKFTTLTLTTIGDRIGHLPSADWKNLQQLIAISFVQT